MMDISHLLEKSMQDHDHLCPRQILGVRIGLAGLRILAFDKPPMNQRLLVISETDGCFVDGVIAATKCTVGHRTLRVEDYGKVAVTFVDTRTGRAIRIAPAPNLREMAYRYVSDEPRHYFAQMHAYQVMPDEEMFTFYGVVLKTPVDEIVSRPGVRVKCERCGEEVINERELVQQGTTLCQSCAGNGYYRSTTLLTRTRPPIYESCQPQALDSEVQRFLDEVKKLSGVGQTLSSLDIDSAL